jgi:hypothetical protein
MISQNKASIESPPSNTLQLVPSKAREYRRARCTRSGRPHPTDNWELMIKRGEELKVLEDRGRGWFVAENARGEKGT